MSMQIHVEGFPDGGKIPSKYTCSGDNVPPGLHWTGAPKGTRSFALIVDDPDAPGGTWNHWLIWDIPATLPGLPAGYQVLHPVKTGKNDFGQAGYGGPCPPKGHGEHRYFFRLYALDTESLGVSPGTGRSKLESSLDRHLLATAEYMGRFAR